MRLRTMLLVGLAFVALVACGQRQQVHLSDRAAAEPAANATPADTEAAEESEPSEPPPSQPATTAPSPPGEHEMPAPTEAAQAKPSSPASNPSTESPAAADPGAKLWNRSFAATAVEVDGQPRPTVDGTELYVMPFHERSEHGIRYHAGCNTGGASLRITPERFVVADDGAMTAVRCSDEHHEQERWFVDFIHSSPKWDLSQDRAHLRLTSGGTVVRLVERAWEPFTTTP